MKISFVTYTYNDHSFVRELLNILPGYGLNFHEIILVDDASPSPFPETSGIKIMRLEKNAGPSQTKRLGMAAATGDVIFSLDADTRPHAKWALNAMRYMALPEVGMAGCRIIPSMGADHLSKALYRMSQMEGLPAEDRQATFLPGNVWLIRRDVWRAVGGLDNYANMIHGDFHLCMKVRQAGWKLVAADAYPVYERRRLNREGYARRECRYMASSAQAMVLNGGTAECFAFLEKYMRPAKDYMFAGGDKVMLYASLLRLALLFLWLPDMPGPGLGNPELRRLRAEITAGIWYLLNPFPKTGSLLQDDLSNLADSGLITREAAFQADVERLFAPYLENGFMRELEEQWVDKMRAEDKLCIFDGHYMSDRLV